MINNLTFEKTIREAKQYAISKQKYELAANLRDLERSIIDNNADKFDIEDRCEKIIERFPDVENSLKPILVGKNRREKLNKLFEKD